MSHAIYPLTESAQPGACELCSRQVERLTRHHLRPREHGGTETALLCSGCHRQVHALFENRTLAEQLDSLEKLRQDPQIRRYGAWAKRQKGGRIRVRRCRSRR